MTPEADFIPLSIMAALVEMCETKCDFELQKVYLMHVKEHLVSILDMCNAQQKVKQFLQNLIGNIKVLEGIIKYKTAVQEALVNTTDLLTRVAKKEEQLDLEEVAPFKDYLNSAYPDSNFNLLKLRNNATASFIHLHLFLESLCKEAPKQDLRFFVIGLYTLHDKVCIDYIKNVGLSKSQARDESTGLKEWISYMGVSVDLLTDTEWKFETLRCYMHQSPLMSNRFARFMGFRAPPAARS